MEKKFVRRSLLYVPGSSAKKIEKAFSIPADSIIFDLEDSVSLAEKEDARRNVVQALGADKFYGKEKIVRINSMDSFIGLMDLITLAGKAPDTILIPKADEISLKMADTILSGFECYADLDRFGIGLIALIETASAMLQACKILSASPRLNGVQLGAEDLTKELSVKRTRQGQEIRFAREMLVYAGCSSHIDIIDTPFTDIHDLEALEEDAYCAKSIGFTGKACVYPTHAEVLNKVFRPSLEETEHARRLVFAYEEALKQGKGACMFEQKMIDEPIAQRARKILEKENFIAQNCKI